MRLTKRQLKQIIREEYARLKVRALLRETAEEFTATFYPDNPGAYAALAEELGIRVIENTSSGFTAQGSKEALLEFGEISWSDIEGNFQSFPTDEFLDYMIQPVRPQSGRVHGEIVP